MNTRRTLRKVGGSVMLPIPPEMLEEMQLGAGQDVVLTSEGDVIRVESSAPRPSPDAVEFMTRFSKKYDEAMGTWGTWPSDRLGGRFRCLLPARSPVFLRFSSSIRSP